MADIIKSGIAKVSQVLHPAAPPSQTPGGPVPSPVANTAATLKQEIKDVVKGHVPGGLPDPSALFAGAKADAGAYAALGADGKHLADDAQTLQADQAKVKELTQKVQSDSDPSSDFGQQFGFLKGDNSLHDDSAALGEGLAKLKIDSQTFDQHLSQSEADAAKLSGSPANKAVQAQIAKVATDGHKLNTDIQTAANLGQEVAGALQDHPILGRAKAVSEHDQLAANQAQLQQDGDKVKSDIPFLNALTSHLPKP